MSADHKRPLLAFALVLVVFVIIVVDGLRGQAAVMTALRSGAGQVVKGAELVAIGAHATPSHQMMEPPVLDAAGTSPDGASPAAQPAAQPTPTVPAASAPAIHGQQPAGPAHPHPGSSATVQHPGHAHQPREHGDRSHEGRASGQQVVQHLTHQLGQLLGQHDGPVPGRGPESRSDRGRDHAQRGHEDHGRGRENRGRSHEDRGHGHAWGRHHGWPRNR